MPLSKLELPELLPQVSVAGNRTIYDMMHQIVLPNPLLNQYLHDVPLKNWPKDNVRNIDHVARRGCYLLSNNILILFEKVIQSSFIPF